MNKKLYQRVCDIFTGAIGYIFDEDEHVLTPEELSRVITALQSVFDPNNYASIFYSRWNISNFATPKKATEHLKYAIRSAEMTASEKKAETA